MILNFFRNLKVSSILKEFSEDGRLGAGNPGMAVGGMGDVLAGAIAALRAQGLAAFEASCAGALLHAAAGDAAADNGERGLLPSDLMPWLRRFANPESTE